MDQDAQDVGEFTDLLTGLDALRFLCSTGKKQACMTKSNIFSKLYTEMQARETPSLTNIRSTTTCCSPRKQRKAYKPSRVVPLEDMPSLHGKSALTDDPLSLLNCPTTDDDSKLSNKKSDISGKSPLVMTDSPADDLLITKTTKGKRNKRQNLQCGERVVCKNLACKAILHAGASFCRRCSCCICKEFDDNKDPSLWITCDAEEHGGCGLSCHVECALHDRVAGVVRKSGPGSLDGSFFCRSCGIVSSIISLWKKQLLIAKNARRVDVFCQRLLLGQRLLEGTLKYKDIHSPIESAVKKLNVEVGLMKKCSAKLERCIVNRLTCNLDVQSMIDVALEKAESLSWEEHSVVDDAKTAATPEKPACTIQFEDVCSSSVVVVAVESPPTDGRLGYKLWLRKATDLSYPAAPTYTIQNSSKKILVSNLQPRTLYAFKMAPFSAEHDSEQVCEAECWTEGMDPRAPENYADDCITDSAHETNNGERQNVQSPQQHSPKVLQCLQKREMEKCEVAMEESNHKNLSSVPGVCEGKDNDYVEVLGDVVAVIDEERKGSKGDACESTELPRVPDTHVKDSKCQEGKVFVLKSAITQSPAMAANVDILDDSIPVLQNQATQLFSKGTQGGHLAAAGNGKDAPLYDCSRVDLHNFEFTIRVIRWLESEGHLDKEFRQKFLTWYSLSSTEHEKRVVSVFIDTLQDSAQGLAAQLVDTFADTVDSKRQRITEIGYYRRRRYK